MVTSVLLASYATAPIREVQPLNISVDSLHVQALLQLIVVKALQPLNILPILVTFSVLKFSRSSSVKAEHQLNILLISVTFSVLRFSIPSIVAIFLQL